MTEYAVVLIWDTESDEGEVPVLVMVKAESEIKALDYAVTKAHDGSLYCKIFNEESEVGGEEEYMEINRDKSLVVEVRRLARI